MEQDSQHDTTQRTAHSDGPLRPAPRSACVVVIHGESLGRRADIDERFEALYRREHLAMLRVAHLLLGSDEASQEAVHDAFVAEVDARHAELIWTHPGMSTYYRNRHGRVVTATPFSLVEYWTRTHDPKLEEYVLTRA